MTPRWLSFVALLSVMGCSESYELVVELRTDYVPAIEVSAVELEVRRGTADGELAGQSSTPVFSATSLVGGVRVGELGGLEAGTHVLLTTLRDSDGAAIASQTTRVEVRQSTGVTVLITRDCAGVVCPAAGDVAATACIGARCVDPACSPETPELCPSVAACSAATPCPPPAASCAEAQCLEGACFAAPLPAGCAMDEACHPETGCQPLPGAMPDSSPPPDTAVDSAADSGTDASVGFSVDTPPSGAMITSFSQTFTGTCDDAATLSVTPESDDLTIVAFECVVGVLTIEVELKAGNGMRTFTVDDGTVSVPHTFVLDRECPPGFIGITGDASYGTDDLCLAKYEMRAEAGGGALANGGNGDMVYDPAFVASSRWDGTPWVRLNRQNASDECMGMPPGAFTGTFRMPTNTEWQVVARNVERTASNWSGGAVGTGMIATGNSDNNERFLEASADDSDGYVNTNNTVGEPWGAGAEQRRTLTLSNGEVVWDLAGNGREWVSDDVSGTDLSPSLPGGFQEYSDTSRFPAMSINRDMFGPSDAGYDSDQGMGQWFGGNAGAVLRGGLFGIWGRPTVGIFALDLDRASTDTVNGAGHAFRCVYIFP